MESSQQVNEMHSILGKRRATVCTAASVAKRRKSLSSGASIQKSLPGGSPQRTSGHTSATSESMLGRHTLHGESQASKPKRFKTLEPVLLSALLSEGDESSVVSTLTEHSPSRQQSSINPECTQPSTPVTRRLTAGVQSPPSVIRVGISHWLHWFH